MNPERRRFPVPAAWTLRLALLGLVFAASSGPIRAQEAGAEPAETAAESRKDLPADYTAEDVLYVEGILSDVATTGSIATKIPMELHETPASVGVVTSSLFEDQGGTVLGDALLNVAGVNVQTQNGVAEYFLIRGFDVLTSGLVLTDGVSEPEIATYGLYNVDRVEVLRGPSAFLYGGNTLSGAASLVRKRPVAEDFVEFDLGFGSFGTTRGQVDFNHEGSEAFRLRLNGFWEDSDGFRDDKESEFLGVNPSFQWAPGEASAWRLDAEVARSERSPDSGLPLLLFEGRIPDVPRERSYQSPFDFSEQDVTRLRLNYQRQVGSRLSLRNKTYYTALDWQSDGTLLNGAFPSGIPGFTAVARTLTSLDDDQEFLGNQLEATLDLGGDAGAVRHRLVAGLEVERRTDEFSLDVGLLPVIGLENPVETATGRPPAIPQFGQRGDADNTIVAPYFFDHIDFSDRFRVLVGGRLDLLDYEEKVSGTQRDDTEFSPMLGLVWAPSANLTLYASAAQAFSPPSTLIVGDIRPEESRQVEVGVKRRFLEGRLQASLAVYDLDKTNIAIPDQTGITRQIGDQSSRGAELEIAALLAPGLRAFFSYAYTDAELVEYRESQLIDTFPFLLINDFSGNTPAFAPEHLARLWVSRRFPGGFGLSGGARFVSEQFIDEDNGFEIDGYVTLDLALSYAFRQWEWRLNFKNVTDEDYEIRAFGNSSVLPADPFSVFGGVSYRM